MPLPPGRGEWHEPFVDRWKLKLELFDVYGALPAAGDRHLAEFFPYFLTEAAHRGADYGVQLTTIPHRQQQVATARAQVLDAIETDLPPLARSPEATADIVSAVANGRSMRTIVNLPNTGQIDNLPRGAVVETLAEITSAGAQPLTVGRCPRACSSTLQPHVANQELIAQAALEGDRRLALQAMVNDPLVGNLETARHLLDELLSVHAAYLPQFSTRVRIWSGGETLHRTRNKTSEKTLLHQLEHLLARRVPDLLIKDFDFDWSVVAGVVDGLAQTAELDDAVAHHPAPKEVIGRRHEPIAHVKPDDVLASAGDLGVHVRVPPHVVHVHRHPDKWRRDPLGHGIRLRQRHDH